MALRATTELRISPACISIGTSGGLFLDQPRGLSEDGSDGSGDDGSCNAGVAGRSESGESSDPGRHILSVKRSSPSAKPGIRVSLGSASGVPPISRRIGGTDSPLNRSYAAAFGAKQPSSAVISPRSTICQSEIQDLTVNVSENALEDPILTRGGTSA
jgi:hypothetical protein